MLSLLPGRDDWDTARRHPRADLTAGLTVAVVALPLALAFGVASGLGARAGLITAIVAGALAAIFGGSNLQVSGPTGAMTVVLIPVVHRYGANGVLMVGMLAGGILVLAAFLRLGRAARYLPAPVVEGFTAGIAVVIVLQQVPAMLGTPGTGDKAWQSAADAARHFLRQPHAGPLITTLAVAVLILIGTRWRPAIPVSLVVVAAASLVVALVHVHVTKLGSLPSGIPAPNLKFFDPSLLTRLLPSALAVAALGALESLLSATVADGMTVRRQHDPDRELFGQGIANLITPLFGGVPATGAIARTAVNARVGATSRLSALVHSAGLAIIVLIAAPLVAHIPLAALAGVLLATCIQMVEVGSLLAIARATRADGLILLTTLVVTVVANLVTAVAIGIAVAVVFAVRSVSRAATINETPLDHTDHDLAEQALLADHIVAYRLDGPLFFAAAHRFLLELSEVAYIRVVILRLSRITALDATGAKVLGDAITRLERRGIVVLLSGVQADHDLILSALGVADHLRRNGLIFTDTPAAIAYARALVGVRPGLDVGTSSGSDGTLVPGARPARPRV
jgi:sulfate permease, SulP family